MRKEMQLELKEMHRNLGITFIYVTHDQEEALTMSDTIVVMSEGRIQQIGTPEDIYNEPKNAFVADFIGDSNIIDGTMVRDRLVEISGVKFACVDVGFGTNKPVDVVIRPEDLELYAIPEGAEKGSEAYDKVASRAYELNPGYFVGVVTDLIFKGVHYEMDVEANGYTWLVHSTKMFPVGSRVLMNLDPFNIQIMNKPESEDEQAVTMNEM